MYNTSQALGELSPPRLLPFFWKVVINKMNGNSTEYRKGIVYFIDVLGSQNRSLQADNFQQSYFIADTFLTEMENVQKRHKETSLVDRCVFSFSDCAYIVYALKSDVEDSYENKMHMIYQSLYNTQQTICNFTYNGFLCRGGVSYGDVYFDLARNMIFGPAVNKAYMIESKEAEYPNISLESQLANDVVLYAKNIKEQNPLATLDGEILKFNEEKKLFYLNYINYFYRIGVVQLGKNSVSFSDFYQKSSFFTESEMKVHAGQTENDLRIRKKLEWHLNYLNQMKEIIENDNFTENDLLDLFLTTKTL